MSSQIEAAWTLPLPEARCVELATQFGTPLLVIFPHLIEDRVNDIRLQLKGAADLRFATKAAASPFMLPALQGASVALDVASEIEICAARQFGFLDKSMHFMSPGASPQFLSALQSEGMDVTVESLYQANQLKAGPSASRGKVFLRLAPKLQVSTNDAAVIAVGANKLGMQEDVLVELAHSLEARGVNVVGLHAHIGSLVYCAAMHIELAREMAVLADSLRHIDSINIGGGMSVWYADNTPTFDFVALRRGLAELDDERRASGRRPLRYIIEPGRAIAAHAAIMLTEVLDVKRVGPQRFICADARLAALDLVLPVRNCSQRDSPQCESSVLVGTCCSPHDVITEALLPPTAPGDLLAIGAVGSYATTLEGSIQLRPKAREVIYNTQGHCTIVREAPSAREFLQFSI